MSRSGQPIVWQGDADAERVVGDALTAWRTGEYSGRPAPRARWLGDLERELALLFPYSSSADRTVTARSLAPFTLVQAP